MKYAGSFLALLLLWKDLHGYPSVAAKSTVAEASGSTASTGSFLSSASFVMADMTETFSAAVESYNISNATVGNGTEYSDYDDVCEYEPKKFLDIRLWLVAVCGTSVCVLSLFENTLLVYLFLTRPRFRTTHLYYMSWLACTDIFMAISYVLLLAVYTVLVDITQSLALHKAVITYLRPMFAISIIAMVTSSYLICAASLERFFR